MNEDRPPKPDVLDVNPDGIAQFLRSGPKADDWLVWRFEWQSDRGEWAKIPCDGAGAGHRIDATDPENGVRFETALETYETGEYDGLGIITDPDDRLVGLDWDDCRDPDEPHGSVPSIVGEAIVELDSYTEQSPSATGYRTFALGEKPDGSNRGDLDCDPVLEEVPHLEMYDGSGGRYLTVTGDVDGNISTDIEERPQELKEIHEELIAEADDGEHQKTAAQATDGGVEAQSGNSNPGVDADRTDLSDSELVEKAKNAENGDKFARLWRGSTSGYESHSEARQALANLLAFWTGRDRSRMLDLFLQSDLYRDGDDLRTFKNYEIPTALESCAEVYEPKTTGSPALDTTTEDTNPASTTFEEDVLDAIDQLEEDAIREKTARHRIALAFTHHFDFVQPEEEVRGWRTTLYVYNADEGIYEPRGEAFIEKKAERVAGDYLTNTVVNEVVEKVRRMSIARGDRFETDPQRLVVDNGILNLHTGELDGHTPAEYHRTKIDVPWNPDVGEPDAIDEFLHDIVEPGDVGTLYRLVAHTLYKEYVGEKAAMLVGGGQNGKSVFLDLVEQFLGGYNVSHRALQEFAEDKFATNALEDKLANIHADMGDDAVRDMSQFKQLTGRDTLTADVKYEKPIRFENHATLMFSANEMPVFGEDNHAVWRRWVYIDFPNRFGPNGNKEATPRQELMSRLTDEEELQALLVRCQQEIEEWHNGRDWYPDAMAPDEVREELKKAAEPVFNFAKACLREADEEDAFLRKEQVRECYQAYATEENLPKLSDDRFGEKLLNLRDFTITTGRKRIDGGRPHVYKGVALTDRGRQVLGLDEPEDNDQSTVGDAKQNKRVVLEEVREMVKQNDNEPVPKNAVAWRCQSEMGLTTAENAIETLLEEGKLLSRDGDTVIDT